MLKTNNATLQNQYSSALQDLRLAEKEYKESAQKKHDELNQSLSFANKMNDKLKGC